MALHITLCICLFSLPWLVSRPTIILTVFLILFRGSLVNSGMCCFRKSFVCLCAGHRCYYSLDLSCPFVDGLLHLRFSTFLAQQRIAATLARKTVVSLFKLIERTFIDFFSIYANSHAVFRFGVVCISVRVWDLNLVIQRTNWQRNSICWHFINHLRDKYCSAL